MAGYPRVLLKLSGEALLGDQPSGVHHEAALKVAGRVRELKEKGHEVALVLGGGNIFRGIQQGPTLGIERTPADQVGMLATLINGVILAQMLKQVGCETKLISAVECPMVAESYQWERTMHYLSEGKIVLFVGGTGHPYFTTDTNAALRASEIQADLLLKATMHVDGVYDKDPRKHKDARKFDTISYAEVIEQRLGIVDWTAAALCMASGVPMKVFNFTSGSLVEAATDTSLGTLIT